MVMGVKQHLVGLQKIRKRRFYPIWLCGFIRL
jgi:hypothetical protein